MNMFRFYWNFLGVYLENVVSFLPWEIDGETGIYLQWNELGMRW